MLNVRLMRIEDLDQVVAIDRLSFSLPWPANSFRFELLENKNSYAWVAELTGPNGSARLVAEAVIWMIVDEAHIATLAVHPDFRRMGIARCLLCTGLNRAKQMGMITATLEVRAGNLVARELYEKFGFQVTGHRPRYYKDNQEDALIMSVYLSQVPAELLAGDGVFLINGEADHES